jgi:hypothetical protein
MQSGSGHRPFDVYCYVYIYVEIEDETLKPRVGLEAAATSGASDRM